MQPTVAPRIKICCISCIQEAMLAIDCGASALGLVSAMPSGPGIIDESLVAELRRLYHLRSQLFYSPANKTPILSSSSSTAVAQTQFSFAIA
ncbi:hypothetical protein [Acaryochloris marina]|uniref:hypothetical protein n=1 Tax=Acaryochloris marina TaxID=155978 RepID=UPI001EE64AEE